MTTVGRTQKWQIRSQLAVQYEIIEATGLLDPRNPALLELPDGSGGRGARLVVLDHSIDGLYGARVRRYFEANQATVEYLILPGNEQNKSMDRVLEVIDKLNAIGTNRLSTPPLVIGGGVVADVVGLAASLYRRGIPYVRVPTTLLSQVDVSVAAKTGINYGGYRNRMGSYTPPPRTLIDREFLATVPERELRSGMGEILKMALIKDARLFSLLEDFGADLIAARFQGVDPELGTVADEVIGRAIAGMAEELEPNLWEKDLRRVVDYGHSFSPLVEMRAVPDLLHGEAVAMDCIFSAALAVDRGLLGSSELSRIVAVARSLGLEPSHPLFCDGPLLLEALEDTVRHRDSNQNLPLLEGVGRTTFVNDVTPDDVLRAAGSMDRLLRGEL